MIVLFTIGDFQVTLNLLIDVVVALLCIVILIVFGVHISKDIKKQNKARRERKSEENQTAGESKKAINETKAERKARIKSEKAAKKAAKKTKRVEQEVAPVDPVVSLLGFDPYSAIESETCEIAETFYDVEQETEDMRILRERMQVARITEKKIAVLNERLSKVKYELEKISRLLRDNKVVVSTATTVSDRLKDEIATLTSDKKTAKKNKAEIASLRAELEKNETLMSGIVGLVDKKNNEERLLRDVQNYLSAEISRTERDLSFINTDIDRLNESVGAELRKIENDNRARALMSKYRELKPLLETVNRIYVEIKELDEKLGVIHEEKNKLKNKLSTLMDELRQSYGAKDASGVARRISEINSLIVKADEEEERFIKEKEDKIVAFRAAKTKANEFLEREKYDDDDIVLAEDKVVGEIEYEKVKKEYELVREKTAKEYEEAQKKYDAISTRKVRFGKKQEAEKRAYEEELSEALTALKKARTANEKAIVDCESVLPSLSPDSLVKSGSGVMSKERISKRTEQNRDKFGETRERIRRIRQESAERESSIRSARYPVPPKGRSSAPIARDSSADRLAVLLERLSELEEIARREEEKRARRLAYFDSLSIPERIEKRKAEVISLRKRLHYIKNAQEANEFKRKLYKYSLSLSEEEMSDTVLSEMIHRLMDEATALGEKRGN